MSERVPEGWTQSRVINFVNVGRGYAFKSFDYHSTGNPIVRVTNISDSNGLDLSNNIVYLTKDRATEFQSYQLKDDDFLLVMVGATIGKYAKVSTQGKSLFLNQNMWRLSVIDKQTQSQKFAIYGLQKVIDEFLRTMQGSAREFLTQKEFGKATLILPPLPEQKKIASILTSVDEVIESTQKQIDKLQDLKKATMNKLLTKGIGHTEFKDSDMGRIPKSWEVKSLGDFSNVTKLAGFEYTEHFDYSVGGEIIAVRALNLDGGKLDLTNIQTIPKSVSDALPRSKLFYGDILISYVGSVGNLGFINDNDRFHLAPNVAKISCDLHQVNAHFILQQLQSDRAQKNIKDLTTITSQPSLNMANIRKIRFLVCPIKEQSDIVKILSSIDTKLENLEQKLIQTQSLKKSLMQNLLTGKVRVKVN